jgi:hypothetical protein
MNKYQLKEFRSKTPANNTEMIAQQLLQLPERDRHLITCAIRKLSKSSVENDTTLGEMIEAAGLISKKD